MSTYIARKELYIQKNLLSNDRYALLLCASKKVDELNVDLLQSAYTHYEKEILKSKDNSDFDLIFFIRLLYLLQDAKSSEYDMVYEKIANLWKDEKFWLTKDEKAKCYWSENHMICYLSSWYLWNQLHKINNDRCNLLLKTYLQTKVQYSFYECYSQVYNTYTLSALLNIYDFVKEDGLKELSKKCIDLLCRQFMEIHLLDGSTFCASGRTYQRYKDFSTNNNFNKVIYLLSGFNTEDSISPAASFMSTSSYIPPNYDEKYTKSYDATYTLSKVDFDKVYSKISGDDKTLFQWSAGNYFNENVDDTLKLMDKYNLSSHSHFKMEPYDMILGLFPTSVLKSSVNTLKAFTDCSDLTNIQYHIYNNGSYSLTSLEGYNRGKMGAQQLPWIANVAGSSFYTQSGEISSIGDLKEANSNSHMPCINQEKNVILMMYQPYDLIKSSASKLKLNLNVYLLFQKADFDESSLIQSGKWLFAKKKNSYIAIYSTTLKKDSMSNYYNDNKEQQGWVIIMGDVNEYNTFDIFQSEVVKQTSIQFKIVKPNKTIMDRLTNNDNYYYGKVSYKGISMEMKW